MIQKRIEKLLNEISIKYDKPYHVIYEVYMSQFKLTRDTIRSLEFKTIKLPSLGKFYIEDWKAIEFKENLLYNYNTYGKQAGDNKSTPLHGEE